MKTTVRSLSALALLAWAAAAGATQAPPSLAIPALGTGGWIVLSLLLLAAGFVVLRRRPPR